MSKIICDICGTSYPENAKQCPICGCVRPGDVQRVANDYKNEAEVAGGYTYVKGGRFSKSNVRKRDQSVSEPEMKQDDFDLDAFLSEMKQEEAPKEEVKPEEPKRETPRREAPKPAATRPAAHRPRPSAQRPAAKKSPAARTRNYKKRSRHAQQNNRGAAAAAIILLLIVIGVVIFISVRFFGPAPDANVDNINPSTSVKEVACKDIVLASTDITLEVPNGHLLSFELKPKETTEKPTFRSDNDAVATVTADGHIEAKGEGYAVITITCGKIEKFVSVTCVAAIEPTTPTGPEPTAPSTTTPTTPPVDTIELNREDITLSLEGESWTLYSGSIAKNLVTFTSDDDSIATFVDGKVVAVSRGQTKVHAEYNGQKLTCVVRCSITYTKPGTYVIAPNSYGYLNVRSGPDADTELAGTYNVGDEVQVLEVQKNELNEYWGKTDKGWINMGYVNVKK